MENTTPETPVNTEATTAPEAKQGFKMSKTSNTLVIRGTADNGKKWSKVYNLLTDKKEIVRNFLQAYVTAGQPVMRGVTKMLEASKCEMIDDMISQM